MTIRELLRSMGDVTLLTGLDESRLDAEAGELCTDSRQVGPNGVFIAIHGFSTDGRRFAGAAVEAGAAIVVGEGDPPEGVPADRWFRVPDARRAAAKLSAAFHGYPSHTMNVYAVTGTNGKTTVATLLHDLIVGLGTPCGLISTVEIDYGAGPREPAEHTTPDPIELHKILARIRNNGCRSVTMEVSSQALDQRRTDGMLFTVAVFTNLTREHLDYHGTMEAYFAAKLHLFELLSENPDGLAVVNIDDPWGLKLVDWLRARRIACVSYGFHPAADVRAEDVQTSLDGVRFHLVSRRAGSIDVHSPLLGRHNVSNLLAVFAIAIGHGNPLRVIARVLGSHTCVCGRLERIATPAHPAAWFVDYAHTPDALDHALATLREAAPGRLVVVFGCGGDRDRGKRPQMGAIAAAGADEVVVTSDNPRSENPDAIIGEILAGVPAEQRGRVHVEPDRRRAIALAATLARAAGDVVLVAGKGHERGQVFADHVEPFDDHEAVASAAQTMADSAAFQGGKLS